MSTLHKFFHTQWFSGVVFVRTDQLLLFKTLIIKEKIDPSSAPSSLCAQLIQSVHNVYFWVCGRSIHCVLRFHDNYMWEYGE